MKRILILFLICVAGMAATARNIPLDLSGSGNARMNAAYFQSAPPDPEEIRSHRLEAGSSKISGLEIGDVITFKLFSDKTLAVTLEKEMPSLSGRSFLGSIDNALGALGCVVLETSDGIVLDVTDFENNRIWQVVSDSNGVIVREVKPADEKRCSDGWRLRPGGAPVNVSVLTENGKTTVTTNASPAVAGQRATQDAVCADLPPLARNALASVSDGDTIVDILVNYDTDAASWAKSNGGGITNFAETCVQKMNTAIANTGLDDYFTFRLVGVYEVGGSAGGDLEYALYFASGYYTGTMNGVSWAGVGAERDRLSADIVCTLCDNGSAYGTVGLGWALISGLDSAGCGFNACQIRAVANTHTMTHEVGHNMGAGHSDAMADADNCGPQYHSYSSGYYFTSGSTKYHTIMAYNTDGYGNYYTSVPYFSSPDYRYAGVAVGDSTHDNTRTLRQTCTVVAANRIPPFVSDEIGRGFEAEDYVWTTDGTYPWTRATDSSYDGVDSSRSCEMPGHETSWTETKVHGPATLSFKLRLRTYNGSFNVLVDGVSEYEYTAVDYGGSWNTVSVSIPSGVHTVRLAYTHPATGFVSGGNGAWVDQLAFEGGRPAGDDNGVHATVDLPTALDNASMVFATGGDSAWQGQTAQTYDGVDAARSGELDDDQSCWLQSTVSGAGTISFKWYVSSEANYDWLEFVVDDVVVEKISGTGNAWGSKSYAVTGSGSHTIQWRYRKDGSVSRGDDAGYLDSVAWTPSRPANDDFKNALRISGKSGSASGSTVDATRESGEPLPSFLASATNTIWWVWTAPVSGHASFVTDDTGLDTVMGIYTGSSVSSLAVVSQDDDSGSGYSSMCAFKAVAGITYYIAVSGYGNANQGTVALMWDLEETAVYTIVFNRMDYSGCTYSTVFDCGVYEHLPDIIETLGWSYSGHYFVGWTTRIYNPALNPAAVVDYGNAAYVKDLAPQNGTVYLYAVWTASPLKSIPELSSSASASEVNAALDSVGFADAGVKSMISGSAAEYAAFKTWAGTIAGGEKAVAISPYASVAYMLGSTRLFGYSPNITIAPLNIGSGSSAMTVAVTVKDGERVVGVDSSKVAGMFEATSNLNDWNGSAKITPTVTSEGVENSVMRFRVAPRSGSAERMFLRIRKEK